MWPAALLTALPQPAPQAGLSNTQDEGLLQSYRLLLGISTRRHGQYPAAGKSGRLFGTLAARRISASQAATASARHHQGANGRQLSPAAQLAQASPTSSLPHQHTMEQAAPAKQPGPCYSLGQLCGPAGPGQAPCIKPLLSCCLSCKALIVMVVPASTDIRSNWSNRRGNH
jgi:hypothetical protein